MRLLPLFLLCAVLNARPDDRLIDAIAAVESGYDRFAVGDRGQAFGLLQIHPSVVLDVNAIAGTRYRHADMKQPAVARFVLVTYLSHYVTRSRLGRNPTPEDYARVWNGGPNGWKKSATRAYWRRVSALYYQG